MDLHADDNAKALDSTDSALAAELTRILETARKQLEEEFRKRLEPEGIVISAGTPTELDEYVRGEEARWRKVVKENNIKPD